MPKSKSRITVTKNSRSRIVIKMDHSSMEDFCEALSAIVDKHVIIKEDRALDHKGDLDQVIRELLLLDLYNRLSSQEDSPLRDLYHKRDKYSVKLSPAEAVTVWAILNPMEYLHLGRPALRIILDGIYKLMA